MEIVACEDQVEIVVRLAGEIWREHFTPIIGKAQVDYMLEKFQSKTAVSEQIENGFIYYLIKSSNRHVGYLAVFPKDGQLFLSKLYIRKSERGKGHARDAINFLKSLAVEKGAAKISLTVNKYNSAAIKAYEKLGFVNRGGIVQDIGSGFVMDDYQMEKEV